MLLQVPPVGANCTSPNPLAALAVMEPASPDVWSLMFTVRPCALSPKLRLRLSPPFMKRSLDAFGVNVAAVASTGLAGAWAAPSLVMNAKLGYSTPVIDAHRVLRDWPVFWFWARLQMTIAAHHWCASQLMPPDWNGAQPGGYNCISRNAVPGCRPM